LSRAYEASSKKRGFKAGLTDDYIATSGDQFAGTTAVTLGIALTMGTFFVDLDRAATTGRSPRVWTTTSRVDPWVAFPERWP
jgi:hypothetical protein